MNVIQSFRLKRQSFLIFYDGTLVKKNSYQYIYKIKGIFQDLLFQRCGCCLKFLRVTIEMSCVRENTALQRDRRVNARNPLENQVKSELNKPIQNIAYCVSHLLG